MRRSISIFVVSLFLVVSGFGQAHIDARGLGLCNAYTVTSRGISAVGYNPANLGYTEDLTFSADFFDFKVTAFNNFMSLALFNQYFSGDKDGNPFDLEKEMLGSEQTHKEFLLSEISEEGLSVGLGVSVPIPLLNVSIGNYAFTSGVEYYMQNSLPVGLFEIVMEGNQLGRSFDLSVTQDVLMVTNFGFSFAVSGIMIPPAVFSSAGAGSIITLSASGFTFIDIV